jgi:hypothetical protein
MIKNKWFRQISVIKSSGIDYATISLPKEVYEIWKNDYQNVKLIFDSEKNQITIMPV